MNQKSEVRGQKSEVREQKTENRKQSKESGRLLFLHCLESVI
jgi:hypothetical protein